MHVSVSSLATKTSRYIVSTIGHVGPSVDVAEDLDGHFDLTGWEIIF